MSKTIDRLHIEPARIGAGTAADELLEEPKLSVGVRLHNRFDFYEPMENGTLRPIAYAENTVLNQGIARLIYALSSGTLYYPSGPFYASPLYGTGTGNWNNILTSQQAAVSNSVFGGGIALGSGNSTPVATQTALDAEVYRSVASSMTSSSTLDQSIAAMQYTLNILAGQRVGDVYREVGIVQRLDYTNNMTGALSTRALVHDLTGAPSSVTVGATGLTVIATLYLTVSHAYGSNLIMPGTSQLANGLWSALMGYPASNPWYACLGTSGTISVSDTIASAACGVPTTPTGGSSSIVMVSTPDYVNKRIIAQVSFGPGVTGTIKDFGVGLYIQGGSSPYQRTFLRGLLPVGDQAASSLAKTSGNSLALAFTLNFS